MLHNFFNIKWVFIFETVTSDSLNMRFTFNTSIFEFKLTIWFTIDSTLHIKINLCHQELMFSISFLKDENPSSIHPL